MNTEDEVTLRRVLDMEGVVDSESIIRIMREFRRIYNEGMIKHYRQGAQDAFGDVADEMMV